MADKRDTLSELARRGIMTYAERATLLRRSTAQWRMGHGNIAPYELLTGSGNMALLAESLTVLRELVAYRQFVFVPSSIKDRLLLTIGDALGPLEYAVIQTADQAMRRIVEGGRYNPESRRLADAFVTDIGHQIAVGVYRASAHSPATPFFAHVDRVHEAAHIAIADSVLQEHRGFPLSIDLADVACRSMFGADTFDDAVASAYREHGEPTRYSTRTKYQGELDMSPSRLRPPHRRGPRILTESQTCAPCRLGKSPRPIAAASGAPCSTLPAPRTTASRCCCRPTPSNKFPHSLLSALTVTPMAARYSRSSWPDRLPSLTGCALMHLRLSPPQCGVPPLCRAITDASKSRSSANSFRPERWCRHGSGHFRTARCSSSIRGEAAILRVDGTMLLGVAAGDETIDVRIAGDRKSVLPRHTGVLGTTGGGKSTTVSRMIGEAARDSYAVILLDTEGEYTQINEPTVDPTMLASLNHREQRPAGVPNTHIYTLVGKDTSNPSHGDIVRYTLQFSAMSPFVVEELLDLNDAQKQRFEKAYDTTKHVMQDLGIFPRKDNNEDKRISIELDEFDTGYPRMRLANLYDVVALIHAKVSKEDPASVYSSLSRVSRRRHQEESLGQN